MWGADSCVDTTTGGPAQSSFSPKTMQHWSSLGMARKLEPVVAKSLDILATQKLLAGDGADKSLPARAPTLWWEVVFTITNGPGGASGGGDVVTSLSG